MCWLTDLFSSKPNTDLETCNRNKKDLTSSLADRTEELNANSVLLAREYEKTTAYEMRIGGLSKDNLTLIQEKADATIALQQQLRNLRIEDTELIRKLSQQVTDLTPTASTFAGIIYDEGKGIVATLSKVDRSRLWFDVLKSTWKVFAKPSIEPYQDVSVSDIQKIVNDQYDGRDELHPKLVWPEMADRRYRITTVANVKEIFATSYLGWFDWIEDFGDCDDFAGEWKIHGKWYTLNTFISVFGDSGWGYHAFNLVPCIDGLVMIEPQLSGRGWNEPLALYCKVLPDVIGEADYWWIPRKIRDI